MSKERNISIVWDFDGTLTPQDSTTQLIEYFNIDKKKFWEIVKNINGSQSNITWEKLLASDTPTWMFILSMVATDHKESLTTPFFQNQEIKKLTTLYEGVGRTLRSLKNLSTEDRFRKKRIKIYHFIVTAGLKEYVDALIPKKLFKNIWGSRYIPIKIPNKHDGRIRSIPVFCMDETMKTRALFEISKGSFHNNNPVNQRVEDKNLWCPFENIIYIGDGNTDIPALALVKERGGYGIVVYDQDKPENEIRKKLTNMSADRRCDLITPAIYTSNSVLFKAIHAKCNQILQKYEAEDFSNP